MKKLIKLYVVIPSFLVLSGLIFISIRDTPVEAAAVWYAPNPVNGVPLELKNATGTGTPGSLRVWNTSTTKKFDLGNGSWASFAVPYFRPVDAGSFALDLMPNGSA